MDTDTDGGGYSYGTDDLTLLKPGDWHTLLNRQRSLAGRSYKNANKLLLERMIAEAMAKPDLVEHGSSAYKAAQDIPRGLNLQKDNSAVDKIEFDAGNGGYMSSIATVYNMELANLEINKNPLAFGLTGTPDMNAPIKRWLEHAGYITSKQRSRKFSRDYHFIQRPYLESDTGGEYRTFAFLTRPDIPLVYRGENGALRPSRELVAFPDLAHLVSSNLELYSELCLSTASRSNIWHFASNYIKEIAPPTLQETDVEGIKNAHDIEQHLPGISSYHNVDIGITFMDNANGDMAKLWTLLDRYKEAGAKRSYPKTAEYIRYNGIDYLVSLYIIAVNRDWEIVSFSVGINMIPGPAPTHFAKHSIDGYASNELFSEFTTTFKCMTFKPEWIQYMDIFNQLTGFNPKNMVDTKGSITMLQVPHRSASDQTVSSYSGTRNITTPLMKQDKTFTAGLNANLSPDIQTGIGVTENYGYMRYKGIYELVAPKAGIYAARNLKDMGRPIFKLGFSY